MNIVKSLSLKTKLTLALGIVALVCPIIIMTIGWINIDTYSVDAAKESMLGTNSTKTHEIDTYFETMQLQLKNLAQNPTTVAAMKDFSKAFYDYAAETADSLPSRDVQLKSISDYYENQFGAEYRRINDNASLNTSNLFGDLGPSATALQYAYITSNTHPLGSKNNLEFNDDGSSYSKAHQTYHPTFNRMLEFGYYDVFLVEPKNGHVVYTVYKEIDYATSLLSGPHKDSGLGLAAKASFQNKKLGEVHTTDLERYLPSYEAAAGFLSTPIYENNQLIGLVIFQFPIEKINAIMTGNRNWQQNGLGETGESYLFNDRGQLLTNSRLLVEDKDKFKAAAIEANLDTKKIDESIRRENAALLITTDPEMLERASKNKKGTFQGKNYLAKKVIGSYSDVNVAGLNWSIVSEIEHSEKFEHLVSMAKKLLTIVTVLLLATIFLAILLSNRFSREFSNIGERLKKVTKTTEKASEQVATASSSVSESTTQQASAIQETVSTLNQISAMGERTVKFATDSTQKAVKSFEIAREGQGAVAEMETSMTDISASNKLIMEAVAESNNEIKSIVDIINEIAAKTTVINDIVFQTKLLSFNASVEAARAGEHGKGFAVVAEEVGNLAQMSGTSASEITALLDSSIKKVEQVIATSSKKINELIEGGSVKVESGMMIAKRCGEVLTEVVGNVNSVKDMMNEITAGSNEVAEGVQNISTAMNQLDQTTHQNSDVAHKTSSFASDLLRQTAELKSVTSNLNTLIYGYGRKATNRKSSSKKDLALVKSDSEFESDSRSVPTVMSTSHMAAAAAPSKHLHIQKNAPKHASEKQPVKQVVGGLVLPSDDDPRFEDI